MSRGRCGLGQLPEAEPGTRASAVADLASRGLGIAILSESIAASYDTRLTALVIDDVQTPAVLALIWTATESPALREFLHHSRQAFSNPPAA